MRTRANLRFLFVIAGLAVLGIVSAGYVLHQQRAPVPFQETYDVQVDVLSSDGVQPGLGQPVNVAGVKVGTIVGAKRHGGVARLRLRIERSKIPRLYRDASATLAPITPLKDMELALRPGHPDAGLLAGAGTIPVRRTSTPVPLSDLLSTLDADTRDFMTSLLQAMDRGTAGRGQDLRKALVALGPTTGQARRITESLQQRRTELARLVHNVSVVTRAATDDRQLASLVGAGNATLGALAAQDQPLRASIAKLPGMLDTARATLGSAAAFSDEAVPTLEALLPATRRLPATLETLGGFSDAVATSLRKDIRPFARKAQPVLADLGPTTAALTGMLPELTSSFRVINYFLNTLNYNAPGDDEGLLFWASWFFHNGNSVFSLADAHGAIGRASIFATCSQLTNGLANGTLGNVLIGTLGLTGVCGGLG
jgi:phospholipid/cholesterol/gamma-HCH transport system substrate-binding protein